MQILRESTDLRGLLDGWRRAGDTLALVPTMGALHDGHLALVADARRRAERVLATIFVNPLQFNDPKDLDRYPRQEESDLAKLETERCDAVWLPSAADLYPPGFATKVHVSGVGDRWEGAHRPGHFDGVATVVAKLFAATGPDIAVFGEKDFQQVAVIRRMTADLGFPIEIIDHPTMREPSGLAMSSRNALLDPDRRAQAPELHRILAMTASRLGKGFAVFDALSDAVGALGEAGFGPIDYVALVDPQTLEPLEQSRPGARLIAAAFLGEIRLIDNIRVD